MNELNYYKPYIADNVVYSCDMLRLKFCFHKDSCDIPLDFVMDMFLLFGFKNSYYRSTKDFAYKHMYVFKKNACIITLGLTFNSKDSMGYHSNFIEFNPNKSDMHAVIYLLDYFSRYTVSAGSHYEVVRYDLAIDIPVERQYVKLIKKGKREYRYVLKNGSVTEYLGNRNTHGFTKVYDKTKESDLYYDCTRIEITTESLMPTLPDIRIIEYQQNLDFDLHGTDKVLVELIRRQEAEEYQYWLRQLGRKKQEKLEKYVLCDKNSFEYDKKGISHVIDIVEAISEMNVEKEIIDDIENFKQSFKAGKQLNNADAESSSDWQALTEEQKEDLNDFINGNLHSGIDSINDSMCQVKFIT